MTGNVTKRNVCQPSAPRSIDASISDVCVRRSRASDVVVDDDDAERGVADHDRPQREVDACRNVEERVQRHARDDPGQRDRQDEQERDRLAAEEAEAVRRANAASDPEHERDRRRHERALNDSQSASRISWLCHVELTTSSRSPAIGQLWMFDELNAYTQISAIGTRGTARRATVQTRERVPSCARLHSQRLERAEPPRERPGRRP